MTYQLTDITRVRDLTAAEFTQLGTAYEVAGAIYTDIIKALNDNNMREVPAGKAEIETLGQGCQVLAGIMTIITNCWVYQIRPQTLLNLATPFEGVENSHTLARYKRDLHPTYEGIKAILDVLDLINTFDEQYNQLSHREHDFLFKGIYELIRIFLRNTWHELPTDKRDYAQDNPMFQQLIEDGLLIEKIEASYEMN